MSSDRDVFLSQTDVSRETIERFDIYAALLKQWTKRINLVAPNTMPTLWRRHFLDSAQLERFMSSSVWVDLGSGGGFPGAVLAILSPETPVALVESDQRKAAFLRTVARETGVGFRVYPERAEILEPLNAGRLSCRALASLNDLLGYAERHLAPDGRAIFMKGASAQAEIDQALEHWRFDCETYPSQTNPEAVILNIGDIKRV
ncbi:MAG: 16S rRNA (guanine(527)-N(7))-methyltransferase RsmG [Silicimonas sp.]|nr:16S rRNA (guanine(527)-N(7))-methyltransferase RsmG [Silicimonas sp.]